MFGLGVTELVIILILALIIFGPGKLPEVGRALGRSIREFREAGREVKDAAKSVTDEKNA
ncbi:MAG: twin-arginine translocase TatA/TatE family subunit [Firmicutes bacterium]|nr:twin-arginine translocase TatA/TatE family subunit [Bacillota bacterium]